MKTTVQGKILGGLHRNRKTRSRRQITAKKTMDRKPVKL